MLCTLGLYAPLYSFSLFLPTIIHNMGYSRANAQFLSVPPYVGACVVTICVGFLADKYKQRGIFMMGCSALALVGWILLISTTQTGVQYDVVAWILVDTAGIRGKLGFGGNRAFTNTLDGLAKDSAYPWVRWHACSVAA